MLFACLTRGMSIMCPRKVNAPFPAFSCSRNSLIKFVAHSIFSSLGLNAD